MMMMDNPLPSGVIEGSTITEERAVEEDLVTTISTAISMSNRNKPNQWEY